MKGEGFFIAAVRKKAEADEVNQPKFKSGHDKKIFQQASYLLTEEEYICIKTGDEYSVILAEHEVDIHIIQKGLYLRKTGTSIGQPGAKEWLPAHDIALSIERIKDLPKIEVRKEQALLFLKKEDFNIPNHDKGWYLISYNGLGLGWVKALGNRFNNYLPKHWRIRMDINEME